MQTNYTILELFPTPIYTTILPDGLAEIVHFFDKQEVSTENDHDNYGYRSKDSYILNKPECHNVAQFILDNAKIFGDQLGYDYPKYRLSQSWISVKLPNQHHTMHTHPNSLISGVFFYGPSTEKTPAIKFHQTLGSINVGSILPKLVENKKDFKYSHTDFSIMFEAGLLLLFPSYLNHSVPLNKTDVNRHSLVFNIVPDKSLGDETTLTELIF